MNIETEKEMLTINKPLAEGSSEILVSGDIIVPDKKPDIARILYVDGKAHIDTKEVSSGRAVTGGTAEFTVLYLPEDDFMPVRNLTLSLPFTDVSDTSDIDSDSQIYAFAEITDIEYTLINSRRVNIKATVCVHIKVNKQEKISIAQNASADIPLCVRTKSIEAYNVAGETDTFLTVPGKIEVPGGNAPVSEVLKMDANVFSREIKLIKNRAVLKGVINLSTLYLTSPDFEIQFMEHELPFTEIIDLPGAGENMDCDVDYSVKSLYFETDDDNESNMLGVEVILCVYARAVQSEKLDIIDDCFSTEADIKIEYEEKCIDKIISSDKENITVKGTLSLPEDKNPIASVYNVSAVPITKSVSSENSSLTVNGVLKTTVLYKSQNDAYPIQSFLGEIPFSYTSPTFTSDSEPLVECSASLISCSYTLSSDNSVDIRANVNVSLSLIESQCTKLISDMTCCEAPEKTASLIVYFVSEGDTVWDIAKKYKTTPEKIIALNSLDSEAPLSAGTKLLIM